MENFSYKILTFINSKQKQVVEADPEPTDSNRHVVTKRHVGSLFGSSLSRNKFATLKNKDKIIVDKLKRPISTSNNIRRNVVKNSTKKLK